VRILNSDACNLKVLHVYRTYFPEPPGGLQEVIKQICHGTLPHGVQSRIFTLAHDARPAVLKRSEADVYRFPLHLEIASTGMSATALGGFRELASWADVINYHFPWPFADVLQMLSRSSTPAIATYHSDIIRQKGLSLCYRPLMYGFLRKMHRIVATSPNYANTSAVLKRFESKVETIPIGIAEDTYPEASDYQLNAVMQTLGQGYFLFIGVLRYYKGLDTLLDAVTGTALRLVVAGEGPEGSKIAETIEQRGLRNVVMLGQVSDEEKVALIAMAKAVVLPSHLRSEAFGVSLLEGAMLGKPLISSEIGTGTSFVNRHGESGIVVSPSDPLALREAMLRLDGDVELERNLGRGARARYVRLFRGATMAESYASLYRTLAVQPQHL
jgi:rhamnosyl/mannosyltransferase